MIEPDVGQTVEGVLEALQHLGHRCSVLDVGGMHGYCEEQAQGIDQDVPLDPRQTRQAQSSPTEAAAREAAKEFFSRITKRQDVSELLKRLARK